MWDAGAIGLLFVSHQTATFYMSSFCICAAKASTHVIFLNISKSPKESYMTGANGTFMDAEGTHVDKQDTHL